MKILSLCLAIAMLVSTACAMPKQLMTTTHRIEMHSTDGTDVCSSTAIGKHALLTATHCDLGATAVTVDGTEAQITSRMTDGNDHTIYILDVTFPEYAHLSKMPSVGDEVWLRGNPDGLNQLVRRGIYSGAVMVDGTETYMFDINGWHGDSGSAIFDKHGHIIAVTSVGFTDGGFAMIGTYQIAFTKDQLHKI